MITTHKQYVVRGFFGKSDHNDYILIVPYWVQKKEIKAKLKMAEKYAKLYNNDVSNESPETYDEHFNEMMWLISQRVPSERIFKWYIHDCCGWVIEKIIIDFKCRF